MADARLLHDARDHRRRARRPAVFTASGKAIQFAGFLRAYVEGSDDPAAELGDQETILRGSAWATWSPPMARWPSPRSSRWATRRSRPRAIPTRRS